MPQPSKVNWFQSVPFILMHVVCLAVFWVGWSWTAVLVALVVYAARVFGLTGFYHRYFSHRTFKTYRWVHFLGALLGNSAAQRGPLWWAAHHRNHHRNADTELDAHSPRLMGFWRSHTVWFLTYKNFATNQRAVPDLMKYPELRFVDRFDYLGPAILIAGLLGLGTVLDRYAPQLVERLAAVGLGILRLDSPPVSRDVLDQFGCPPLWQTTIRHRRRQPQQRLARAVHVRRRLA